MLCQLLLFLLIFRVDLWIILKTKTTVLQNSSMFVEVARSDCMLKLLLHQDQSYSLTTMEKELWSINMIGFKKRQNLKLKDEHKIKIPVWLSLRMQLFIALGENLQEWNDLKRIPFCYFLKLIWYYGYNIP